MFKICALLHLCNCVSFCREKQTFSVETRLTVEGVDPSGDPLQDGVLHFPSPHALDAQILETVKNTTIKKQLLQHLEFKIDKADWTTPE